MKITLLFVLILLMLSSGAFHSRRSTTPAVTECTQFKTTFSQ